MNPKRLSSLSTTTSGYKHRFVLGFLRALRAINRRKAASSSLPPREICKRSLKVKKAADASMASAIGSTRVWSRALLRRIRGRDRRTSYNRRSNGNISRARLEDDNNKSNNSECKTNELRKLVPGGETMEMSNLLDETAHYIKCLTTQVKLMRGIADFYSSV